MTNEEYIEQIKELSQKLDNWRIVIGQQARNVYQQGKSVDVKNGIKGDNQGGHIIARVFNGPVGFFVEYKIDGIEQSPIYHYN